MSDRRETRRQEALLQKFASPEEQVTARQYIDQPPGDNSLEIKKAVDRAIADEPIPSTPCVGMVHCSQRFA